MLHPESPRLLPQRCSASDQSLKQLLADSNQEFKETLRDIVARYPQLKFFYLDGDEDVDAYPTSFAAAKGDVAMCVGGLQICSGLIAFSARRQSTVGVHEGTPSEALARLKHESNDHLAPDSVLITLGNRRGTMDLAGKGDPNLDLEHMKFFYPAAFAAHAEAAGIARDRVIFLDGPNLPDFEPIETAAGLLVVPDRKLYLLGMDPRETSYRLLLTLNLAAFWPE